MRHHASDARPSGYKRQRSSVATPTQKQQQQQHAASWTPTPFSDIIQRYVNDGRQDFRRDEPIFGTSNIPAPPVIAGAVTAAASFPKITTPIRKNHEGDGENTDSGSHDGEDNSSLFSSRELQQRKQRLNGIILRLKGLFVILLGAYSSRRIHRRWVTPHVFLNSVVKSQNPFDHARPEFVNDHPYVTSSYYTATSSIVTLEKTEEIQVEPKKDRLPDRERGIVSRLAIVRPFCEFDADALPTTFACWNSLVPCRAAEEDLGDDDEDEIDEWVIFDMSINGTGRKLQKEEEEKWECEAEYSGGNSSWFRGISSSFLKRCKKKPRSKDYFDDVPADGLRTTSADLFLFYSQTFSENEVAMHAVDEIMNEYFSPGGWSRCFDNIYAIEANIPPELDLYIPAAQEELYNWVNGPNRQFEAAFRIIQSGEWGDYDGFYLMEGDSVPVKNYWLDVILGEINAYRPFAVLGAQYDGDKWDSFYEQIPISLLHHTNGNGIYNTSHPLLERLVGQLEVEAPCPYNSIPYDYRMSQMWVEGTLGIVPKLAPKIMLNEEGQNITLSDNRAMFNKWANRWEAEEPYKFTKAIHNYAATNLIPRHLGPEYVIHGAKLYSPWDPSKIEVTLVISEWFFDRSLNLIKSLDTKDHPFNQVIIMIPPSVSNDHDYSKYTKVPVTLQFRDSPDFMDLCSAEVSTKWFMITNAYHLVSGHVDLMFTPGKFVPVIPFTPATYPFCLKYPYCNEIVKLAQRWNPSHKQVVLDMDMLYSTKERNEFCEEWVERNGDQGEDLYAKYQPMRYKHRGDKIIGPKGPTGTDYLAYLASKKKDGMYKMTDRSLYGARDPFVKVYRKEEKLDGMSEDELARRLGWTLMSNITECSCDRFETEEECLGSGLGCLWRALFESCHPPEMIDDGVPICSTTDAPTLSPTVSIDRYLLETESPTAESAASESDESSSQENEAAKNEGLSLNRLFKSREHHIDNSLDKGDESSSGNRLLLSLSDDAYTQPDFGNIFLNSSQAQFSTFKEHHDALELLSNIEHLAPSQFSNDDVEPSCPTWGPSIVPHRFNYAQRSVEESFNPNSILDKENIEISKALRLTKTLLPGRMRHAQHQLVNLQPSIAINQYSVEVPKPEEIKNRRINVNYGDKLEQLRINFVTDSMSTHLHDMGHNFAAMDQYHPTYERITAYIEEIFPSVKSLWGEVLTIFHPLNNLVSRESTCGGASIPEDHLKEGVDDADVVIYVEMRDQDSCSIDSKPQIIICHFDQNLRPLFGSLSVCLDDMEVQGNKVYENEILRHVALLTQLVGRFLGLSPNLFKYFRNPETGQLWGERTVQVTCGDDGVEREVSLSNIIEQRGGGGIEPYYEISSPKVRQTVRNHFDCQELTGARLAASLPQSNDDNCIPFNLDLRFHFDEDMTAISQNADAAFAVSPLSLALLEDSSWYKANFSAATTPTFGRGAGCGFLGGECVTSGKIPDYSEGFFCASSDETGYRSGCDYTHRNKASCDLDTTADPPMLEFGSHFDDTRYCPMRSKHLVSCSSKSQAAYHASLLGESFEDNSRCYETDSGLPVCLETMCNSVDKTLNIVVGGNTFQCSYFGQVINVDLGYSVVCPRIAVVCPDLVCPSNCSGKGVCDYCREAPGCICDNPFDETAGCWDS